MKIIEKTAKEIIEGDILILNLIELDRDKSIYFNTCGDNDLSPLIGHLEGESAIFLFEVDNIDSRWIGNPTDEEVDEATEDLSGVKYEELNKKYGVVFEFTHLSEISNILNDDFEALPSICCINKDRKFTVIENPFYTIPLHTVKNVEKIAKKYCEM